MNKFIAYFDYLGFKEFIENNDLSYQRRIMANNFRDMESALSNGKTKEAKHGVVADMESSNINCINFSDTVVYWSNDDSYSSLVEILDVAFRFNWQSNRYFFPSRGAVAYGELEQVSFEKHNEAGGVYNINSVYGKGLVSAHQKAESQDWAGTVFDESIIQFLVGQGVDVGELLEPYAKLYPIPYKSGANEEMEYAMNFFRPAKLSEEAFENSRDLILRNFAEHNKSVEHESVQRKISNTIEFLKSFCEK